MVRWNLVSLSNVNKVMSSFNLHRFVPFPVVLAAALAAGACGSDAASELGDELPAVSVDGVSIDVYGDSSFGQIVAQEQQGNADRAVGGFDLEAVDLPAGTGEVFRLAPRPSDSVSIDERVIALAQALGLSGEIATETDPFGGVTRRVAGEGPNAALLEVFAESAGTGGARWSYQGPAVTDVGGARELSGVSPDAAEARVGAVLAALDVAAVSYLNAVESFGDTVEVNAVFAPDGRPAFDVRWNFIVGATGEVELAQGPFDLPERVGDVTLVDLDVAASRLDVAFGPLPGNPGGLPPATTMLWPTTTGLPIPATTTLLPVPPPNSTTTLPGAVESDVVDTTTTSASPSPPDDQLAPIPSTIPAPLDDQGAFPSTTPAPFPSATPAPCDLSTCGAEEPSLPMPPEVSVPDVEIRDVASRVIVDVEQTLLAFWDSPSGPWLVPAYRFVAADGGRYEIIAVDADHVRLIGSNDPELPPAPPSTGSSEPNIPGVPDSTTTSLPDPNDAGFPQPTTTLDGVPPRTVPMPNPTLLDNNGTPVTLPVPPPVGLPVADIPDWYNDELLGALQGRSIDEAVAALEAVGWRVQLDDELSPNDTFTAEISIDRVIVVHRDGFVTDIKGPDLSGFLVDTPVTTTLSANQLVELLPVAPAGDSDESLALDNEAQLAGVLVGLPWSAAADVLAATGWSVRAFDLDGSLEREDDLRLDRINVFHRDGIVERVEIF